MTSSRSGNIQDEPGGSCMPENEEVLRYKRWGNVKRTQEPSERAPDGQSWDNWRNKINNGVMDYNPKYKMSMSPYGYKWTNEWMNGGEWTVLLYRRSPNNLCRYCPLKGGEYNPSPIKYGLCRVTSFQIAQYGRWGEQLYSGGTW